MDQHHQPAEKRPRKRGEYGSRMPLAEVDIEQTAMPEPCFLLAKDSDKRVSLTRSSHYLLQARGSSLTTSLRRQEMPVPALTAHRPRHSKPGRSHNRSA